MNGIMCAPMNDGSAVAQLLLDVADLLLPVLESARQLHGVTERVPQEAHPPGAVVARIEELIEENDELRHRSAHVVRLDGAYQRAKVDVHRKPEADSVGISDGVLPFEVVDPEDVIVLGLEDLAPELDVELLVDDVAD